MRVIKVFEQIEPFYWAVFARCFSTLKLLIFKDSMFTMLFIITSKFIDVYGCEESYISV